MYYTTRDGIFTFAQKLLSAKLAYGTKNEKIKEKTKNKNRVAQKKRPGWQFVKALR